MKETKERKKREKKRKETKQGGKETTTKVTKHDTRNNIYQSQRLRPIEYQGSSGSHFSTIRGDGGCCHDNGSLAIHFVVVIQLQFPSSLQGPPAPTLICFLTFPYGFTDNSSAFNFTSNQMAQ
jgi:hypothetical protein